VRQTLSRASDTFLLGAAVTVTSLGVVTAGPALAAAATVVREWQRGESRPLHRTFRSSVRRNTGPLLLPQLVLVTGLAVLGIDAAAATLVPGGPVVRAVLGLLAVALLGSWLAMFPVHAQTGGSWWAAWGRAARLCVRKAWLPLALAAVLAVAVLLALTVPATAVITAGPLVLATGVLTSRAQLNGEATA
jgi:uncharacterized membrane protein YesL